MFRWGNFFIVTRVLCRKGNVICNFMQYLSTLTFLTNVYISSEKKFGLPFNEWKIITYLWLYTDPERYYNIIILVYAMAFISQLRTTKAVILAPIDILWVGGLNGMQESSCVSRCLLVATMSYCLETNYDVSYSKTHCSSKPNIN